MKNKNVWVWVVIVAVVFVVWFTISNNKKVEVVQPQTASDQSVMPGTEDVVNNSNDVKPLSYQQALTKYKDKRIQLDTKCQATPNNVTYKNNTSIMIDNRSPVARTLKIGGVVSVKAWGFKIVNLSSTKLPATWLVDCDKSQNVATILIQK